MCQIKELLVVLNIEYQLHNCPSNFEMTIMLFLKLTFFFFFWFILKMYSSFTADIFIASSSKIKQLPLRKRALDTGQMLLNAPSPRILFTKALTFLWYFIVVSMLCIVFSSMCIGVKSVLVITINIGNSKVTAKLKCSLAVPTRPEAPDT